MSVTLFDVRVPMLYRQAIFVIVHVMPTRDTRQCCLSDVGTRSLSFTLEERMLFFCFTSLLKVFYMSVKLFGVFANAVVLRNICDCIWHVDKEHTAVLSERCWDTFAFH